MKPAFISYRRKDTGDIAGRIFDRLSGYFGPGSTLLDVDALVAGGNYRTQIERLLERCHVTLAIIGEEWLTATDAAGKRRLDNPDDQLRIEIAVALASGRTVIPVLVHETSLPAVDELPDDMKGLAVCDPHVVQSGAPFNTDIQLLIERLEDIGLRPPEQSFPWQMVLLPLGVAAVIASIVGMLMMRSPRHEDYILQQIDPTAALAELRTVGDYEDYDGKPYGLARYDLWHRRTLLFGLLPMALGPLLIVWGKRICCLSKERTASRRHYAQGAGRLPTPKSGKSVLCLALGMASIGGGIITALPALVVGAAAWRDLRRHPTWMRGRSLVVTGVIASCVGMGVFYFSHLPQWRFRAWIAHMEAAQAAQMAGDDETALRQFDEAVADGRDSVQAEAVSQIRRGALLLDMNRPEEAAADLSTAIEKIERSLPQDSLLPDDYNPAYLKRARTERAVANERLGRSDEAAADRRWEPSSLDDRSERSSHQAPSEENDLDGVLAPPAPPPPAPVADPSA